MKQEGNRLIGYLPKQPAAGKLDYFVHLVSGSQEVSLTGQEPVVIRFKGHIPASILIVHVIIMFLAMLFAARAGLAALNRQEDPARLTQWAAILLFTGAFILGGVVQKMAFGAFWSGFPLGSDLTDTKTLIAMLAWIAALASGRKTKPKRGWVLAASIITLLIYLIPHSIFGS
jgi:ABC-type dipeptide/oligopeptide/nickel transport system permease component